MCLHTIILDPTDKNRMFMCDFGRWRISHRRRPQYLAAHQPGPEIANTFQTLKPKWATAFTTFAMHKSRPNVLYMQKHWT